MRDGNWAEIRQHSGPKFDSKAIAFGSTINLMFGASTQINGDGDTVTGNTGAYVNLYGSNDTITAGYGFTLNENGTNDRVTLGDGSGLFVSGSGNTNAVGVSSVLTDNGNNDVGTVGIGSTLVQNGTQDTGFAAAGSAIYQYGSGDHATTNGGSLSVYGANESGTVIGASMNNRILSVTPGGYVNVQGSNVNLNDPGDSITVIKDGDRAGSVSSARWQLSRERRNDPQHAQRASSHCNRLSTRSRSS